MSAIEEIELIDRMSASIAGIVRATGRCDPKNLLVEDFSQEEIDRFWPMAFALASIHCDGKILCVAK